MKAISIMYHDVVESGRCDSSGFAGPDAALYKLEPDRFRSHLKAIRGAIQGMPARVFELGGKRMSGTPFLITVDDGGISSYTCIADLLEEVGWRGHFFVTTDYVDSQGFLSRSQIRELRDRGHVIGSHSCSHPIRMSHCSWEEMLTEWGESIAELSDILGEKVRVASTPGGYYSRKVAESAAIHGIEFLFTSEPTVRCRMVNGCLVLGRYTAQRSTSPEVAASIACGKIAPRFRQLFYWNLKKMAKVAGGKYYMKLRESLLNHV